MFRFSTAFRMTLGVVGMTVTTMMLASVVGILPYANQLRTERKVAVCESLAINCSLFAQRQDSQGVATNLNLAIARNEDILSIALRRADGRIAYQVGDHANHWNPPDETAWGRRSSTRDNILVPILSDGKPWGDIEVSFDANKSGLQSLVSNSRPFLALLLLCGGLNSACIFVYVRRTLMRLDVSPPTTGRNATPILDEKDQRGRVLASIDRIREKKPRKTEKNTEKKSALEAMFVELRDSRDEIKQRNLKLQTLAHRDALTGCPNRRTFFEGFEKLWSSARRHHHPLGCLMLDIDLFKSINDDYGHSLGDEVLRKVARAIQDTCRDEDTLCRYGGEEFCMLTPHLAIDECHHFAERIRELVQAIVVSNPEVHVSVSVGISAIELGAHGPQEMLDQADQAMKVAKRYGRNRVCRWDSLTESEWLREPPPLAQPPEKRNPGPFEESIPYPAVASLLSALAFRDPSTAAHSTRVAEMSVATARGLMSVSDAYVLETAALLHDIGKIGVPDRILMKPGPLTDEEWRIMKIHDQIGVDIVVSSFSNQKLVDIVKFHHASFEPGSDTRDMPHGDAIPVGARIVTIADAYDAMVSDRVYRKGSTQVEAFAELRRCAGRQFDPRLVERFIAIMENYREQEDMCALSKQTALQLGLQMEQLASAMDNQDVGQIAELAGLLESTAAQRQVPQVEHLAGLLRTTAENDSDLHQLVSMTRDLLDLCRVAQRTHIESTPESIEADAARRMPLEGTDEGTECRLPTPQGVC